MRKFTLGTLAVLSLSFSMPAAAAETIGGGGCMSDLTFSGSSTLLECYGRFSGNVLNNSPATNLRLNTAMSALGYTGPAIIYSAIEATNKLNLGDSSGVTVNFPGVLNGEVWFGLHSGGGGKLGVGNQTSFYRINAVNLDSFQFNPQGASGATLLAVNQTAVPEPSTWAMMLLGFGFVGGALRSAKRRRPASASYV